ncbi:MAG TPA: sulfatase [Armatimonadaceae bacterium]|nr:sulfatase [Armatimonadaceae bacterium]
MKCVMVMFDSLNRRMLPPYAPYTEVRAPNFARLAARTATFDTSYVCSMPCMPARRDFHTARPNFLHRSWGPLEPFDDSVPQMLKNAGVYTHLATDHYHYFEDGGATYHTRYSSWEFFRGQEGDPWVGQVADPEYPAGALGRHARKDAYARQDLVNRAALEGIEAEMPQPKTFAAGLDFIARNADRDNWFLQIETFDPHEPFFAARRYRDAYPYDPDALFFDWPHYDRVTESPEAVRHVRYEYAALVSQCDACLGRVLDAFDRHDLWKDTMLVVWTDHGFLLGEHDCWAKIWMPFYEEIARTPFFVWDPRHPEATGQRRESLVQPSIDLGPTLLGLFGVPRTPDMLGKDLEPVVAGDAPVREAGIFGLHGGQVNVTDGRHVYMRARATADNAPLFNYTHMPTAMRSFLDLDVLRRMEIAPPFSFTRGCPTMRLPAQAWTPPRAGVDQTLLWDVREDPHQSGPRRDDPDAEARMVGHLTRLMEECDAPPEQYVRLGLRV